MILWSPILVTLISLIIKQHPSRTQGLALSVTALLEYGLGIKEDLSVPQNWPGFFSLHKAEDTNQPGGKKKFQGASF